MSQAVVYVVDDDRAVRHALQRLLKSAGYRVLAHPTCEEFLRQPPSNIPGCLLLDIQMPGLSGLELQEKLAESGRRIPVVFITGYATVPQSVQAMKAGAHDFLEKPFDADRLLEIVGNAIKSDQTTLREQRMVRDLRERFESLTPREREVMAGVVAGKLNKQIAGDLGTSEKTIKVHRARVMEKMQAESVAELVRMAERLGDALHAG